MPLVWSSMIVGMLIAVQSMAAPNEHREEVPSERMHANTNLLRFGLPRTEIIDGEPGFGSDGNDLAIDTRLNIIKSKRSKRYVLIDDFQWTKRELTWNYDNSFSKKMEEKYTLDSSGEWWMGDDDIREVLRNALQVWANVTNLTFKEVSHNHADIRVTFSERFTSHHQSGLFRHESIPYLAIADLHYSHYSYREKYCTIYFNIDRYWEMPGDDKRSGNLMFVAVHEFGHALGLNHASIEEAIMFERYDNDFKRLHRDDIKGIQAMYGKK